MKPIAMKCSKAQFEAIRPKLEQIEGIKFGSISSFCLDKYLVNNYGNYGYKSDKIANIAHPNKGVCEIFDEWNEDTFLEYCVYKPMKDYSQHNLDVKHYRNGDLIQHVQSDKLWTKIETGAWCYVDKNDPSKGVLYNHYAVSDPRGLAPKGYRIPTKEELEKLDRKQLPMVGYRSNNDGSLVNVGSNGVYWSSTVDGTYAWYLFFKSGNAFMGNFSRANGFSVRCIKDETNKENKPMNTKQKLTVPITDVLEIHKIACNTWKSTIAINYLGRVDGDQNITFTQSEVDEMFKAATPEQLPVLERIFGKKVKEIHWDKIKTGSKVMIKHTGKHCGGIDKIDITKPVDVIFYKAPHFIRSDGSFAKTGSNDCYSTFYQNGKYGLFSANENTDYITEVIEY